MQLLLDQVLLDCSCQLLNLPLPSQFLDVLFAVKAQHNRLYFLPLLLEVHEDHPIFGELKHGVGALLLEFIEDLLVNDTFVAMHFADVRLDDSVGVHAEKVLKDVLAVGHKALFAPIDYELV